MELLTLYNFPFPDHTTTCILSNDWKEGEIDFKLLMDEIDPDPRKNFVLSDEDKDVIHAGFGIYTMFLTERYPIPEEWKSYGRTILFKRLEISRNGGPQRYIAGMTYIKGLIYDSREPDAEWIFRKVMLDEDGKPIMHFGKEDLSCFYRYLLFEPQ